ncbi:unnamed protein product [Albugo candida]|uniref:RxLR effector protein n=1 Tax=Albugo candida TaxID=65357 RepID=A0A024GAW5_9STRA|nr:unnamed protein product [Albugo candida]|eukprot:CCI43695.1 unnamed protein product [Albugo candida]
MRTPTFSTPIVLLLSTVALKMEVEANGLHLDPSEQLKSVIFERAGPQEERIINGNFLGLSSTKHTLRGGGTAPSQNSINQHAEEKTINCKNCGFDTSMSGRALGDNAEEKPWTKRERRESSATSNTLIRQVYDGHTNTLRNVYNGGTGSTLGSRPVSEARTDHRLPYGTSIPYQETHQEYQSDNANLGFANRRTSHSNVPQQSIPTGYMQHGIPSANSPNISPALSQYRFPHEQVYATPAQNAARGGRFEHTRMQPFIRQQIERSNLGETDPTHSTNSRTITVNEGQTSNTRNHYHASIAAQGGNTRSVPSPSAPYLTGIPLVRFVANSPENQRKPMKLLSLFPTAPNDEVVSVEPPLNYYSSSNNRIDSGNTPPPHFATSDIHDPYSYHPTNHEADLVEPDPSHYIGYGQDPTLRKSYPKHPRELRSKSSTAYPQAPTSNIGHHASTSRYRDFQHSNLLVHLAARDSGSSKHGSSIGSQKMSPTGYAAE